MRAEDVARKHQFREGFTLVDYAEVGLPVFRLTIEAVTTSIRSLPTIQEFVMRCMALGEDSEPAVARMLGLREDIVRGAVDALVFDGLSVRSSAGQGSNGFRLSSLGMERLDEESREIVQEEMLVVDYDAIRRMPIRLAGENVVRAADLRLFGAVEIRPYPATTPALHDLAIPEVTKAIRRQSGEDFKRTVLALKRVVRRGNLFREAVALIFAADRGNEVQVAFALDGRLSDAHERSFAEHGGPRKMGFVRAVQESGSMRSLGRFFGGALTASLPDGPRLAARRKEEAEASTQLRSVELAVEASRSGRPSPAVSQALSVAKGRLSAARRDLDAFELRPLACYEQSELLAEAIAGATRSLTITSAGLQPSMLTPHLMRDLDRLLTGRIPLHVASYLAPRTEPRGGQYDPASELSKWSHKGRMQLTQTRRGDFFFLIRDDDLAVVSNRPFLGDVARRSSFSRVDGLVTRHPPNVERIREMAVAACHPITDA